MISAQHAACPAYREGMAKYRKRPPVVEAVEWQPGVVVDALCTRAECDSGVDGAHVHTARGAIALAPGDFIVTDENGRTFPCKPDVFHIAYEPERAR